MLERSKAYPQLKAIVSAYGQYLPVSTYPWVTLSVAACSVFFAWFGGNYLFHDYSLWPRMLCSWSISALEYSFLLPGIGASVEVLGYSQNSLAVIIHALQLAAYFVLNMFTTQSPITWRHCVAFPMMIAAVILVAHDPSSKHNLLHP